MSVRTQLAMIAACRAAPWLVAILCAYGPFAASADEPPPGPQRLPPVATPASLDSPSEFVTRDELEQALDKAAWRKGDLKITPYGALWGDMIYATQRTNPGAYTLFVPSTEEQGEDAFTIDARRTRLGLELAGPGLAAIDGSSTAAKLEIDFHGNFVTENRAGVLLRLAYWELKNDDWRLLMGQAEDVISPLNPGSLNYSVGWNGGNIGFRRAQVRAERHVAFGADSKFLVQTSLNHDIVSDFQTDAGVRRESADWPVVQGRTGVLLGRGRPDLAPIQLGVSGHIGQSGFDFLTAGPPPLNLPPLDDARYETWSFNVDLRLPLGPSWGVQGEFFHGANLSSYLGGIGQGVCPCARVPIRSTGGWGELWLDWTPTWHSHVGYGIDDPRNGDSLIGRVSNQFVFANLSTDLTKHWTTGVEVSWWKTLYHDERVGLIPPALLTPRAPGESITIDWMVKFGF